MAGEIDKQRLMLLTRASEGFLVIEIAGYAVWKVQKI
jgi:hypothetical protein